MHMNILMVCLGNICRSPLAEGIMKEKAKKYNLQIKVDSAGTAAYHAGEYPDSRSMEVALKNGIDISDQRARKFRSDDFERFDKIFAMDDSNYSNLIALAQTPEDKEKVEMILNKVHPGEDKSVPDPYYGGKDGFDKVFDMLDKACEKIASEIATKNN
ncbi:MAG: low molecular weight phosphotyrosine protein phosphatase [Bacteroidetes bacterium]|nr:MAG: low molecular weight phosphotyrosine protein phosphatase [Bacteroidota bacterium]